MKKSVGILILLFIFTSTYSKDQTKISIVINHMKKKLIIDKKTVKQFTLKKIYKILGKPDRIKEHRISSYIDEYPFEDGGAHYMRNIKIKNFYYIYDNLGIMFYTDNSEVHYRKPSWLYIKFRKRNFKNIALFPFIAKKTFNGKLIINQVKLKKNKKLVEQKVTYLTKKIELFHTFWGATSISTIIDRLYLLKGKPYIELFLDDKQTQRISYVLIRLK